MFIVVTMLSIDNTEFVRNCDGTVKIFKSRINAEKQVRSLNGDSYIIDISNDRIEFLQEIFLVKYYAKENFDSFGVVHIYHLVCDFAIENRLSYYTVEDCLKVAENISKNKLL